ncbi:MAG: Xaa-Pro peptidase family protein [Simkaniaceae bacterium]|nr:Xaa-Pro peptidase family protein [Simkaniaceae bacterium]
MGSKNTFDSRLDAVKTELKKVKTEGYLCDRPTDIFYLTGLSLSVGRLLIRKRGRPLLFVDGRYYESAKRGASGCVIRKRGVNDLRQEGMCTIGFDASSSYASVCEARRQLRGSGCRLVCVANPVASVRTVKDKEELRKIRKSAAILREGMSYIYDTLREGVAEHETALELECHCRRRGAEGLSFPPIVAFGPNSAFPHHDTGNRTLKRGDLVLIDAGVFYDGYASDCTRTFFFGKKNPRLLPVYETVLAAKKVALALCEPGVPLTVIDKAARQEMDKRKLAKHFTHSLGHGIGLEVHEAPYFSGKGPWGSATTLQEGMVITIEPGLYLPDVGGIRSEDMIIITEKGHENLFPRE